MTVFEEGERDQGDWFPFFNSRFDVASAEIVYDKPEEGAAEFCFRSPAPFWEERRKGRKKEYKMVLNTQSRQMERVGYYDDLSPAEEIKERDDSWDYAITGMRGAKWTGVPKDMECTRENKLKLLKNASFARFANRVLQMIFETGSKVREESEKNS